MERTLVSVMEECTQQNMGMTKAGKSRGSPAIRKGKGKGEAERQRRCSRLGSTGHELRGGRA